MPVEPSFSDLGTANVLRSFQNGTVGGCQCSKGKIDSSSSIKVLRQKKVVYDGECIGLQLGSTQARVRKRLICHLYASFQTWSTVNSVEKGQEFGITLLDFEFRKGDVIQCYEYEEVQQEPNWEWS